MTTAESRQLARWHLSKAFEFLAYVAETADSAKHRKEAADGLLRFGYVRTAKRDGDVLNVRWYLKK